MPVISAALIFTRHPASELSVFVDVPRSLFGLPAAILAALPHFD